MKTKASILLGILITILATYSPTFAQNASNPLQSEVDEAEARAKIAKAKKEEIEAKFPAPDIDALKANNTVEGQLIESRIQAYKAMENISNQVAEQVCGAQKSNIKYKNQLAECRRNIKQLFVYREEDYAKFIGYRKLIQQLNVINNAYSICKPQDNKQPSGAFPFGPVASIFLNWLPLLKTDTTIKGSEFDIENEAVWASLANSLNSK